MAMDRITSPVAKEGYPFMAAAAAVDGLLYIGKVNTVYLGIVTALVLFIGWFFRNPKRNVPVTKGGVVSPADGRIISVEEVEESRILNKKLKRISVFMSVFNVHVNRIPLSGVVKGIFYNKGKYISAFKEKASLENEQNAILIETEDGKEVLFVQIAGLIARRIVCYLKSGDKVLIGDRFGLIRFGSRVDVYIPLDAKVNIKKGDIVKAGETILAQL